ncbi:MULTISPECIES: hypothetical protein [unclassified Cupriavidus]|uniref:hypothetical protein n=1 Tax=unclassified Cupriavidus TaxID=2640874 RepID=UPI0010F725A9|nr:MULTISPECIES: hypothetical protein [unclassified Cupriavidus]MWL92056.1 hypothetical protein [Cupriavidus sp. SW-Y-13]
MRFARNSGRTLAAILGLAVVGGAYADDDTKTITQKLIDADGRVALQKIEQDLNKGAPPAAVSAAPNPAQAKAEVERSRPRTIALYGVDGRSAGGAMSLRSYVQWGGETYSARVGAKWRGYTVSAITESGTTLTKGKSKLFAPYEQDDAVNLFEQRPGGEGMNAARPSSPLPQGGLPGAAAPSFQMPSTLPQPAQMPAAPIMPPIAPPQPGGMPPVAQR